MTPGPPSNDAFPILLNTPAPMTAAIPSAVRSFTPSTFLRPIPWLSLSPDSASLRIFVIDFLRKSVDIVVFLFGFNDLV